MNALSLPQAAEPLLLSFSVAFTHPTFNRFLLLAIGAVLSRDRQTITRLIWTMRAVVTGHASSFHRVFSRAVWALRSEISRNTLLLVWPACAGDRYIFRCPLLPLSSELHRLPIQPVSVYYQLRARRT